MTNQQNTTTTSATTHETAHAATTSAKATRKNRREDRSQDRLEEARSILSEGLADVATDPEALARYLRFRRHFRDYSPHNTLLILSQRPSARYCMGYRAWQKHGRQVRRGEKGLMVFAPILRRPTAEEVADGADPDERLMRGFRITYTFDYAQTDAACEDALVYESPVPRLGTEEHAELCAALERVAAAWGYRLTVSGGYAEGYCDYRRRLIGLRQDLALDDRAAVLAHELAHAAAHDPSRDKREGSSTRASRRFSHAERELQAEGAAFLACFALGLDTSRAALPYLKSYAEDDEALWAQLTAIERIANRLVAAAECCMHA